MLFRVTVAVIIIVCVSALLAFAPGALHAYNLDAAMPLAFGTACVAAFSLLLWLVAWLASMKRRCDYIAICLTAAELEMNNLLFRGYDQSGRLKKMVERQEWAKLVPPTPTVLVNSEYKNPIEPMYAGYEKDMAGSGGDKRLINQSAFIMRDVMRANLLGAKMYIEAAYRNSGKLPHIPAGIAEIIGLKHFDPATGEFPHGCGENWRLVQHVIKTRGFPAWLTLVEKDRAYKGMDVLNRLTAHQG